MPELPEVEVVRRGLARWVAGRTVRCRRGRPPARRPPAHRRRRRLRRPARAGARSPGPAGAASTSGCRWTARRPDDAVLAHLGMSGQLLVRPADSPDETHLRVRLAFTDDGPELRFVDQRTFGGLAVVDLVDGVPVPVAHIARDPLDPAFDDDGWVGGAAPASHRPQAGALLDQTLASGIGNIYADEALWRARLHWARATDSLPRPKAGLVLSAARAVMVEALEPAARRSTRSTSTSTGRAATSTGACTSTAAPASRATAAASLVVREPFMNRSSFRCPRCQPRPRLAHF